MGLVWRRSITGWPNSWAMAMTLSSYAIAKKGIPFNAAQTHAWYRIAMTNSGTPEARSALGNWVLMAIMEGAVFVVVSNKYWIARSS